MEIEIMDVYGLPEALWGMGLSHGVTHFYSPSKPLNQEDVKPIADRLKTVARRLAPQDGGHNKFLECIVVWLAVRAPRYWWQEFDTYRVGVTRVSASTMHTLTRRHVTPDDFETGGGDMPITQDDLESINRAIDDKDLRLAKRLLPESFLQDRLVCLNYKALRNIVHQRHNHRLIEWSLFVDTMRKLPWADEYIFSGAK